MTTNQQQKIRIGLFIVVAGVLAAIVLVVFAGVHFWTKHDRYYVVFDHSVYGLEPGADVSLNGIRVGKVKRIEVAPDDPAKVRVALDLDEGTPVSAKTEAILRFAGITGLKVIDMRGGSASAPKLPPGSLIPVGETMLDKFEKQAETMVDQTNDLLAKANKIVDHADQMVANLTALTEPTRIADIMTHARATAVNLQAATAALRTLIDENRTGLRSSIAAIETTARRASELVDGDQLKAAVADLRQASHSFKEFAREVRQNPSRLLVNHPERDRKLP